MSYGELMTEYAKWCMLHDITASDEYKNLFHDEFVYWIDAGCHTPSIDSTVWFYLPNWRSFMEYKFTQPLSKPLICTRISNKGFYTEVQTASSDTTYRIPTFMLMWRDDSE